MLLCDYHLTVDSIDTVHLLVLGGVCYCFLEMST